jgi:hypothetical protein
MALFAKHHINSLLCEKPRGGNTDNTAADYDNICLRRYRFGLSEWFRPGIGDGVFCGWSDHRAMLQSAAIE